MRALIIALAVLVLLWPAAVSAQQCAPLEAVLEAVHVVAPIKGRAILDPVQTVDVIKWWNEARNSEDDLNFVVILLHDDGSLGIMVGVDEHVCMAVPVPPELVPDLLKAIAGTSA